MAQLASSTVFGSFRVTGNTYLGNTLNVKATSQALVLTVTSPNDAGGNLRVYNSNDASGGISQANALIVSASKYGTSQLMKWANIGTRLGNRASANGDSGALSLTYGADVVGILIDGSAGDIVLGSGSPLNDGSTNFKVTLKQASGGRVARFDGVDTASVWWGGSGTQQFAIDSISGGGANFYMYSSSTWLNRLKIGSTSNGYGANLFTFTGYTGTTASVPLVGYTDTGGSGITDNEGTYRNLIYFNGANATRFYIWNGSASNRNFNMLSDGGFTFGLNADSAKVIYNATDASIDFILL